MDTYDPTNKPDPEHPGQGRNGSEYSDYCFSSFQIIEKLKTFLHWLEALKCSYPIPDKRSVCSYITRNIPKKVKWLIYKGWKYPNVLSESKAMYVRYILRYKKYTFLSVYGVKK